MSAILAVLSLFLPWTVAVDEYTSTNEKIYKGAFDYDEMSQGEPVYPDSFSVSVTIFLVGTIIAFITPLGGMLQFIGSMGFVLASSTTELEGFQMTWWIGSGIALVASIVLPLWNIPLIVRIVKRRSSNDISVFWAIGVWVCLLAILPSGLKTDFLVWKVFSIFNFSLFSFVAFFTLLFHNRK